MHYGGVGGADNEAQWRTAYREAEKKYQLSRERQIKMKRGKPKPGKLVTRPIDMSDVIDLRLGPEVSLPSGVLRHQVPDYNGPVYTFSRHPGLVFMPSALPAVQQLELATAAMMDFPQPPARTNHDLQYGPLTGLWRAAQQGLRLNWNRRDKPHTVVRALSQVAQSGGGGGSAAGAGEPEECNGGVEPQPPQPPQPQPSDVPENVGWECNTRQDANGDGGGGSGGYSNSSSSSSRRSTDGGDRSGSCSSSPRRRSSGGSGSGSSNDCCCENTAAGGPAAAALAPTYEECWSSDGVGPPAGKLLRKLRWATLGPQFEWTQRRYDFEVVHRRLPSSLEDLAKQMAAVVDSLQVAGIKVMAPAAASGGYKPDAAIVNYYQQGDVLGGHLDDVERDMAQPIVSVSLGCPAIFLIGGPTKQIPPSALLLRGGDVLVLAGEARTCYHGVPRILEANRGSDGIPSTLVGAVSAESVAAAIDSYIRSARINISIRAVS